MACLFRKCIGVSKNDKGVGPFVTAAEVLAVAQPTDLIEFERELYIHWGMYVGFDCVIHLNNMENGKGVVLEELLEDVAKGGKCRINNKSAKIEELSVLPGYDDTRSAERIIEDARAWIYPAEDLPYDVMSDNCEHVCMKWKYGVSKSEQVENAAMRLAGGIAGGLVTAPIVYAVVDAVEDAAKAAAEEEARAKAEEEKAKAKAAADEEAEKLKSNLCVIL